MSTEEMFSSDCCLKGRVEKLVTEHRNHDPHSSLVMAGQDCFLVKDGVPGRLLPLCWPVFLSQTPHPVSDSQ